LSSCVMMASFGVNVVVILSFTLLPDIRSVG
jgi:hypothetical protein